MIVATAKKVRVNGKEYSIVKIGRHFVNLIGAKGASYMLSHNAHDSRLYYIFNHTSNRDSIVTDFEVIA